MTDPAHTGEPGSPLPRAGLTARQRRALGIVLAAPTLTEGCKLAGIGRTTWWSWRKQEPFRKAVESVEDSMLGETLARLKAGALRAEEVLSGLLDSKVEGVRLQAATVYLRAATEAAAVLAERARRRALEEED